MSRPAAGCLLLLLIAAPSAAASDPPPASPAGSPQRPPSTWIAALQLDRLSTGGGGGGAAFDWLRPTAGRWTFVAGLSSLRLDDVRWSYGKLGAVLRPAPGHVFDTEARFGRGEERGGGGGDRSFDYLLGEVGYTRELVSRRLYLRLADQFLDIDRTRGNLLKSTLHLVPSRHGSAALTFVRSTGGDLGVETTALRLDLGSGGVRFLVGGSHGRSRPELFDLLADGSGDLEQAFAGVVISGRRGEWIVVLDHLKLGQTRRDTLTLVFKLPARGGGGRR